MAQIVNSFLAFAAAVAIGSVAATRLIDNSTGATTKEASVAQPVQPAAAAPEPPRSGYGSVTLDAGPGGHYQADVEIYGRRLPMLVDTGATIIALTERDARSVGVNPAPADYTIAVSTANGVARAAPVTLREVRIRNIAVYDVQAVVMPRDAMGRSLLGMSFLKKLRGFGVESGRLVLRQ
ncbi:MAG: TIGR02281 family clan AA aspartic protease [Rhizobiales bacterium]|nr:TIGR02281 family clan AA aspartic protease [Hyphomicrobiales bacterium]